MISPSFEKIDYQLRYNKHIERKLIFDLLMRAKELLDFSNHRYLGFGSMWFADFRLAHRLLGLEDMISMEREQYAERARFNSPYHCVSVLGGDSSTTLSEFNWDAPVLSWLDYDGVLDESVSRDLRTILGSCTENSIVIVTTNAVRENYRPRNIGRRTREDTALGQIERLLTTGVVPARFEPKPSEGNHGDVNERNFPCFLAEAILAYLSNIVASGGRQSDSGERFSFFPLFNFCHKDGANMVTVGGVVTAGQDGRVWRNTIASNIQFEHGVPAHQRLDLVPLTLKEKIALDACLPEREVLNFIERAKMIGVRLAEDDLVKYWHHHRHFPLFFEAPI